MPSTNLEKMLDEARAARNAAMERLEAHMASITVGNLVSPDLMLKLNAEVCEEIVERAEGKKRNGKQ